jgi:hypothetical protein
MDVKTVVFQVYAVGMHHYGRKELHVGVGYKLKREPENKYHANAVSMQHDYFLILSATWPLTWLFRHIFAGKAL